MTRPATSRSDLLRHGFVDADRTLAGHGPLGEHAEPLVALLGRTADPDLALTGPAPARRGRRRGPRRPAREVVDDEGTAMRLLSVLGASQALADHLARHPDQWRELADPTLGSTRPAAYAVRAALLTAVGADPLADVPVADPPGAARPWTRCGWSTAACCSAWRRATWPTTSASTTSPPSCPTSRPARSRPGWRSPGRRWGRTPPPCAWPSSRWASAAATSSTTSPTST